MRFYLDPLLICLYSHACKIATVTVFREILEILFEFSTYSSIKAFAIVSLQHSKGQSFLEQSKQMAQERGISLNKSMLFWSVGISWYMLTVDNSSRGRKIDVAPAFMVLARHKVMIVRYYAVVLNL